MRKRALESLESTSIETSEGLEGLLETIGRMTMAVQGHRERLGDEALTLLIQQEDAQSLKKFLRGEQSKLSEAENELGGLVSVLDAAGKSS